MKTMVRYSSGLHYNIFCHPYVHPNFRRLLICSALPLPDSLDGRNRLVKQNIRINRIIWTESNLRLRTEEEAMGRPSKVEHPHLHALGDPVSFINGDLARRHLCHPYGYKAHQPDLGIIGFDEDECTSG